MPRFNTIKRFILASALPIFFCVQLQADETAKPASVSGPVKQASIHFKTAPPETPGVNPAPLHAEDGKLQEVIEIAGAGASELALQIMDRVQDKISPTQARWIIWEKQRLRIYAGNQQWENIVRRVKQLPAGLPDDFFYWARTQMVKAYLQLHKGRPAREELRQLILLISDKDDSGSALGWLQKWRRMIIQGYITEGLSEDALIAILRYQQDYSQDKNEILLLRARVLLMTRRAAEVVELLSGHTNEQEAGMLYLLAQLRSEARSPVKVLQAGLRHLRNKKVAKRLRSSLWAIVAEAAQRAGDRGSAVNAFEHVIADSKWAMSDRLFEFDANSLWNAYLDYALYEGNRAQLLIGQDEAWFSFAKDSGKKYPIKQRAVYALLIHRGNTAEHKLEAARLFIKSIHKRHNNSYILQELFTKSKYFQQTRDIPEPVRRALVDIALAKQDIPLASKIMATLSEPPKGETSYMWHLRRARILILGGQPREGARALEKFTQMYPHAKREQIDRFLQVVFDLQTVGEHDAAFKLFYDIIKLSKDKKLQRELYYWMADSRNAQSRYAEAAELYLRSAMLLDGKGLDPWGQTARYQAAKALGKAGLFEDAYVLYQFLLKVTREEDRRAVIRYEVQKLQLAKSDELPEKQTPVTEGDTQ